MSKEKSLSLKQIIDVLTATLDPSNNVINLIPDDMLELFQKSILTALPILKTAEMISNSGGQIDHQDLYQLLYPLLTDKAVIDSYNKWKNDLCCMTPQMLKHYRMQVIIDVLKRGIMNHAEPAFNYEVNAISDDEITQWISCDEKFDDNLKKELAKLKRYLIKEGDIIIIDRHKFGNYAMKHINDFSYEDTKAMFELDAILDLVNTDLATINPKLRAIIHKYRPQPITYNEFAPAIITKQILKLSEVTNLITNRKKYTNQWIDKFIDDLMASDYGKGIAKDWANSKKRNKIPALIAGTLVNAGVFSCSNPELARAISQHHNIQVTVNSYATYMGKKEEQPYLEWVQNYVKSN